MSFNTFWFVRLRLDVVQEAEYERAVLDVYLPALVPGVVVVLQFTWIGHSIYKKIIKVMFIIRKKSFQYGFETDYYPLD